ncbi:hypothetical protein GTP58_27590 [Duganella sp. CY15W]|uniref:hypothetical protein n=1 Tax=Duganella sp. CY15W TaxID=2692172 RepID=UPI00136BFCCE|nr:hypothetical protein [Duganella sp. CY15W]MYM32101.1 hypothetical protein [Duganella sp. CY15W]
MLEQAFRPFLEALNESQGIRHIEGEFTNPEALFQTEVLAKLDEQHKGLYALFLYDLRNDEGVAAYLQSGGVGNDSTDAVLVLYEKAPRSRRSSTFAGLDISLSEENPAVVFARDLFPAKPLKLPGVLLLQRIAHASDAVYVPLEGNQEKVTARVRKLFPLLPATTKNADLPTNTFGERVGKALDLADIPHQRSEPLTAGDYLRKFLIFLWKHKRDLAAIVPFVGKAVHGNAEQGDD